MLSPDPVVSNTTPIISLVGVGLLDLLHALYGEIWIPPQVLNEYDAGRQRHMYAPDLATLPWILVRPAQTHPAIPPTLDPGEAAALSLAISFHARFVLLDEDRARKVAVRLGLPVTGSLGVLLQAKQRGLVPLVAPVVDAMIAQGRRIGPRLRAHILAQAGE